jgi:hypothetical protein
VQVSAVLGSPERSRQGPMSTAVGVIGVSNVRGPRLVQFKAVGAGLGQQVRLPLLAGVVIERQRQTEISIGLGTAYFRALVCPPLIATMALKGCSSSASSHVTERVVTGDARPRISLTTFVGTQSASIRDAAVCLVSCRRITDKAAAFACVLKATEMVPG